MTQQRITLIRPAKAKQTGPNLNKMIFKRDFVSRSIKNNKTPVDVANEQLRLKNEIKLIRGD